ncbi:MAG TPA: class I SAM-dependent methyltransferase [Solirubrobacteraceae bacterium]|nr:class I SAM-dependent methyltransferase [Solirubrobacteraceae bacterium]
MAEQQRYLPGPERERRARSFGAVAQEYERGRPAYPRAAIEWLLGRPPLRVLDLGAGTGKLSAAVLAAGHSVVAVEPLAEMREVLRAALPQLETLDGRAEALPLAADSVDAVVVGAAFHWFEQGPALAEVERVLRAPGTLGLLGNGFDTSLPWAASLREILGPPAIEKPGHWPDPETLRARFAEVGDRRFPHAQPVDRSRLRDLALSRSSLAVKDPRARQPTLGRVDELWERHPELAGRRKATLRWVARVRRCRALR